MVGKLHTIRKNSVAPSQVLLSNPGREGPSPILRNRIEFELLPRSQVAPSHNTPLEVLLYERTNETNDMKVPPHIRSSVSRVNIKHHPLNKISASQKPKTTNPISRGNVSHLQQLPQTEVSATIEWDHTNLLALIFLFEDYELMETYLSLLFYVSIRG